MATNGRVEISFNTPEEALVAVTQFAANVNCADLGDGDEVGIQVVLVPELYEAATAVGVTPEQFNAALLANCQ